jgi:hypothetical protein
MVDAEERTSSGYEHEGEEMPLLELGDTCQPPFTEGGESSLL